jgi:hypothetical protein
MAVDLARQIACVEREIALRETVYPRWVTQKKLTDVKAAYEIRCMKGVLETLKKVSRPWDGVDRRQTMPDGENTLPLPEDVLSGTPTTSSNSPAATASATR